MTFLIENHSISIILHKKLYLFLKYVTKLRLPQKVNYEVIASKQNPIFK